MLNLKLFLLFQLVIHVGWDGADYDVVSEMISQSELQNIAQMTFHELEIVGYTQTKPSWITQLSGQPWNVSGVVSNSFWQTMSNPGNVLPYQAIVNGMQGAMVTGKCIQTPEQSPPQSGNLCIWWAQGREAPLHFLDTSQFSYLFQDKSASHQDITNHCIQAATQMSSGYLFCHYQWPDYSGHEFGGESPEYRLDLRKNDYELGILRQRFPEAVFLLTSDHGFELSWRQTSDPVVFSQRKKPFGFSHLRSPRAIIASTEEIQSGGTERDVFHTIAYILGMEFPGRIEGKSLLP